jgi:hypothetical protein
MVTSAVEGIDLFKIALRKHLKSRGVIAISMGECLDQPAKLSPELREEKGYTGIMPNNYQILPPSSNCIYKM